MISAANLRLLWICAPSCSVCFYLSMQNVGAISGSILVLDDQGSLVESAIITGSQFHDQTTPQLRITFERGLAGWVVRSRQAALVPDTSKDERWVSRPEEAGEPAAAKVCRQYAYPGA